MCFSGFPRERLVVQTVAARSLSKPRGKGEICGLDGRRRGREAGRRRRPGISSWPDTRGRGFKMSWKPPQGSQTRTRGRRAAVRDGQLARPRMVPDGQGNARVPFRSLPFAPQQTADDDVGFGQQAPSFLRDRRKRRRRDFAIRQWQYSVLIPYVASLVVIRANKV